MLFLVVYASLFEWIFRQNEGGLLLHHKAYGKSGTHIAEWKEDANVRLLHLQPNCLEVMHVIFLETPTVHETDSFLEQMHFLFHSLHDYVCWDCIPNLSRRSRLRSTRKGVLPWEEHREWVTEGNSNWESQENLSHEGITNSRRKKEKEQTCCTWSVFFYSKDFLGISITVSSVGRTVLSFVKKTWEGNREDERSIESLMFRKGMRRLTRDFDEWKDRKEQEKREHRKD